MRELVLSFRRLIALSVLICLFVLASPARSEQIAVGKPAPALTFTDLLQAPAGTRTDWHSLRGKVVVLEFWATWCGGCIIEIPHLNDLEKSLAATPEGAKIKFIAVDDEDPALVKKFIAKVPIGGWLGIDTSKKIITAYGAKARPLTVVVDPKGRIAAIFGPQQLKADQLQALADGKPVTFPADEMAGIREEAMKQAKAAVSSEDDTGNAKPIFDLAIRPGDPNGRTAMTHRSDTNDSSDMVDVLNAKVSMLLEMGADVDGARLTVKNEPATVYDLHLRTPQNEDVDLNPAIEQAIAVAARMKIRHVTAEEDVWVLTATPQAARLLEFESLWQCERLFLATRRQDGDHGRVPRLPDGVGGSILEGSGGRRDRPNRQIRRQLRPAEGHSRADQRNPLGETWAHARQRTAADRARHCRAARASPVRGGKPHACGFRPTFCNREDFRVI